MALISVDNVSVIFQQRRERMLLRDHLREFVKRMPQEGFYALHDVSFRVEQGESIGIIGANGAGKSTLLAILAGLGSPDRGSVSVSGKVGALLDLGSGFHPDLTGRENILINAALMGLTEKQARAQAGSILDFSELAEFIDEPLRTYSSGMILRLAFSVAIHAYADVLLVDEILAVGDIAFQRKCLDRVHDMQKGGRTLVCVSHVPRMLEEFCDRLIWLHHGQLIEDADFPTVSAKYAEFMSDSNRHLRDDVPMVPVAVCAEKSASVPSPSVGAKRKPGAGR